MDSKQLKDLIIVPTLEKIGLNSLSAINLLLGTASVESNLGEYIEQKSNGPAKGIYQVEMATHDDIFNNFLNYENINKTLSSLYLKKNGPKFLKFNKNYNSILKSIEFNEFLIELISSLNKLKIKHLSDEDNLIGNLYYSTAIARVCYYRVSEELPAHIDINKLGKYWKKYYNTSRGKGTVDDFVKKYYKNVRMI